MTQRTKYFQLRLTQEEYDSLKAKSASYIDADCRIEYENGMIFARRPHFTESAGIVTMQFNAIDWYCVRVIRIEDVEKYFPDEKMLAQSSNLKVFQSYENQELEYSCVFVPYDGSNYVFV